MDWNRVDLTIQANGNSARVIQVVPGQIVTKSVMESAPVQDGKVVADPGRDILKIAVIERHHGTGKFSVGLIRFWPEKWSHSIDRGA